jgi:hypothetical protein
MKVARLAGAVGSDRFQTTTRAHLISWSAACPAQLIQSLLMSSKCHYPENNPLQPENWLIEPGQAWAKESAMESAVLPALVEQPDNLWFDPAQKSDRASAPVLQKLANFQSLYLIRPEKFCFQIRSRVWDGYAKKQQRGIFSYRGKHCDFALTDPLIGRKYFPDYPRTPDEDIQPADASRILLCVSLTPPFHDLHYKVIATVFEMPA